MDGFVDAGVLPPPAYNRGCGSNGIVICAPNNIIIVVTNINNIIVPQRGR